MKITRYFLSITLISIFHFQADASTLSNAHKKFQAFKNSSSKIERKTSSDKEKVYYQDEELFKIMRESVQAILDGKEKATPEFLKELVETAVQTFETDPSLAAADFIYPLYEKDKKSMENAIHTLPAKKAEQLLKAFKNIAREIREGNG